MNLEDLCGQHIFEGIDQIHIPADDFELERDGLRFMLDGKAYEVRENPDDGYRSYCGAIWESDEKPRNTFVGVPCVCHMDESEDNEILVFRDMYTGKIFLRIGTNDVYDFYPVCIFDYTPENMSCNEGKEADNG